MVLVAVTGASGFIGSHVVNALLRRGHTVRAVVRDPSNDEKINHLRAFANAERQLTFASGDLLSPGSFDEAFAGVDVVIHTAAVVEILRVSDPQKQIVDPSLRGVENVLSSIDKAGTVKILVHTSSCIASMSFEKPEDHVFTEEDWNTWSTLESDAYGFAKTEAEKLMVAHAEGTHTYSLHVMQPGVVLGPVYTKAHTKSSTVLVREMLYHNPMLNYQCTFVDVRDVAEAHVEALERPASSGGRFLLVGDTPAMRTTDLGPIAAAALPDYETRAVEKYPPWKFQLLRALSFLPMVGPLVMSDFERIVFERSVHFSNKRAKEILGMSFRPLEETVRDSAISMIDGGFVKPKLKAKESA